MQPTPVKEVAVRENIPVLQPRKVRDPEVVEELRTFDADDCGSGFWPADPEKAS